jgi:hypothetical protein
MHRASVPKIATLNSASIMVPSTESTLEGLISRALGIFPVTGNASDERHSLVLLIGCLLAAQPWLYVTVITSLSQDQCFATAAPSSPAVP